MAEFEPNKKGLDIEEIQKTYEESHRRNGTVVGVRIIRGGGTEMYFPAEDAKPETETVGIINNDSPTPPQT
jgi:hypothetical protein